MQKSHCLNNQLLVGEKSESPFEQISTIGAGFLFIRNASHTRESTRNAVLTMNGLC